MDIPASPAQSRSSHDTKQRIKNVVLVAAKAWIVTVPVASLVVGTYSVAGTDWFAWLFLAGFSALYTLPVVLAGAIPMMYLLWEKNAVVWIFTGAAAGLIIAAAMTALVTGAVDPGKTLLLVLTYVLVFAGSAVVFRRKYRKATAPDIK